MTPTIFDPTNGTSRPAHTFNQVDERGDYKLLEGATGDLFVFEPATFRSFPVSAFPNLAEPLDEAVLAEGIADPDILKAIFVAGSGGSGKGLITDTMFAGTALKVINQDNHLERFMAAANVPLADVGLRYDLLKKAQRLKNAQVRQYGARRLGIVIDSTGWDYERIAAPAKKLRNLGYDIFMVFVTTTLKTALARNKARGDAGGRKVPDSYIETAHKGAHANLAAYRKLFGKGNLTLIGNDTAIAPEKWKTEITPKLRKVADRILKAPLRNPRGKAWLVKQSNPATATDPTPAKDWPVDAAPPPIAAVKHALPVVASAPVIANVPAGSPKVKHGWNNNTKQWEGIDIVSVPTEIITEWATSAPDTDLPVWLATHHPDILESATV